MKKVLCFGDSNTYGYIPKSGLRYDKNTRWSGVLEHLTNGCYKIIEAGGNNRTGFTDSIDGINFTGYKILPSLLEDDLYAVILAIGINDLQKFYYLTNEDIKSGLERLIKIIKSKNKNTNIILVSPARLTVNILKSSFVSMFDETSIQKSEKIGEIYKNIALKYGFPFLDLNDIINVSPKDGLHYTPEGHKLIAHKLYKILGDLTKLS